MKRGAGILMPIFSIPCKKGRATLGKCAYEFVDFLYKSNQIYWQVLPINDPDEYGSPFTSTCVYSGNPLFIDLDTFVDEKEIDKLNKISDYLEYKKKKMILLFEVYKNNYNKREIEKFICENDWVISYSEFMTIKEEYGSLIHFSKQLKDNGSSECRKYLKNKKEKINFYIYCQYLFFKQWFALKEYANSKGILIIGDSPCNSSMDSKEAWNDKEMYLLDEELTPTFVAGVPPDYFSSSGQVWNTLIYNYEKIREEKYKYLLDKYKYLLSVYDFLKIDHFRGLECFYRIPYGSKDGKIGEWVMGPGYEFIDLLKENGITNLILEDLGIISDGVVKLKNYSGYPGMKVFQFAFSEDNSPFLPENYDKNCVAYTGTHDNDTLCSYLTDMDNLGKVKNYLSLPNDINMSQVIDESIKKLYYSNADIVIINPQDILKQSSEYRFNTPGTTLGNWKYQCDKKLYDKFNIEFLSSAVIESQRGR